MHTSHQPVISPLGGITVVAKLRPPHTITSPCVMARGSVSLYSSHQQKEILIRAIGGTIGSQNPARSYLVQEIFAPLIAVNRPASVHELLNRLAHPRLARLKKGSGIRGQLSPLSGSTASYRYPVLSVTHPNEPQLVIPTDIRKPPGVIIWRKGAMAITPCNAARSVVSSDAAKPRSTTAHGPSAPA